MPNERSSDPVQRALWFVENRLSDEMSPNGIADVVGVSPEHLARAFGAATGRSLMNYARGRRLTEAVRRLVDGDASILALLWTTDTARTARSPARFATSSA